MKTGLFLAIGLVLLAMGLVSIPRLVGRFDHEDGAFWFGRALVVGAEVLIGACLVVAGIRAARRGK